MNDFLLFGFILLIICIIGAIIIARDNKKYNEYISSIKVGDIFVWDSQLSSYYDWNNKYNSNPFLDKSKMKNYKIYPDPSYIIRDLKYNEDGELWAAYSYIDTEKDIERNDRCPFYKKLTDLIKYYTRVDHYEQGI